MNHDEGDDNHPPPRANDFPPSSIHPGHACLLLSLPFCIQAYRGYHHSLQSIVVPPPLLQPQQQQQQNLSATDDIARRAFGFSIASRALKVATYASVGGLGLFLATAFYATNCTSMEAAVDATRHWAHDGRRRIDANVFGITNRLDRDHPHVKEVERLSEEEQLRLHFPKEDYEEESE